MLLIVCILQVISAPIAVFAANEVQPEPPTLVVPSGAAAEIAAPPAAEASAASTAAAQGAGFLQNPGVSVPEQQNLVALIGRSEITVLENVGWQFVKSMDDARVIGDEFASQPGDTDLSRSISAGRSFSRESLAAAARTEQAKARTGQALGVLLPSVTVRANYGTETSAPSVEMYEDPNRGAIPKDTHDRTDVAWTVSQPLFDLPGYLDWRRRQVIEQASHESYRVSDGDAYLATTNAYLTLVSTRLHTDLTRDFEKQLADLLSYIEKRARGGAASVSDMARVRARSQETLSFRLEQEAAHEAAGIDFVRLTNLVPSRVRLPEFADIGADNLPDTFSAAIATAMQHNPEVAGLAAEIRAAEIDKKAAKSQFLPRLDAEYTDTYSRQAGGALDDSGNPESQRDKRGMLVFSWSPLNGGRDYQYYLERTSRYKELQYRLDDERRRVVQALSANYSTLAITVERIKSGYKELQSISMAVEAMSKRMLSGNQSLLDLLDVYDRFYQARSRLVDLHILEMYTMAQLVRLTTGTPWAVPADAEPVAQAEPAQRPVPRPAAAPTVELVAVPAPPPASVVASPAPLTPEPVASAPDTTSAVAAERVPPTLLAVSLAPAPPESIGIPADTPPPAATESVPPVPVVVPAVAAPRPVETAVTTPPIPVKSPPVVAPAAAVSRSAPTVDTSRAADDAYAPLWLDIIPQSGTALAAKSFDETAASAERGVATVVAVQAAPVVSEQTAGGRMTAAPTPAGIFTLGLLDTGDQTKLDQLVRDVEGKLGQPVKVQLFASEDALVKWFKRLEVVDLVVIPVGERGDLLAGDYALLQTLPASEASARREILVARRNLAEAQLQRLTQAFGTKP